jgi:ceramide glucosyltransferase
MMDLTWTWQLIAWLGDACALAALAGAAYLCLNIVTLLTTPKPRRGAPPTVPVSILVPLCGAEEGLYERLAVLCRQDYGGLVQLVCGAQSAGDPAVTVVERLIEDLPHARIELAIDGLLHGPNRKISNLINMLRHAEHDTLVMLDSDIIVDEGYLSRIVCELAQPGVGAVTCLYYGAWKDGVWAELSSMGINAHFLPNVISALRLGMAKPCFGATIAMTRPLLERIGTLRAFADCLYDDYAIGAAVRAAGYEVAFSSVCVGHVCQERTAQEFVDSQFRRARTIRAIDPLGNAGSAITYPLALALLALGLGNPEGLALVFIVSTLRIAQCLSIERRFGLPRHRYLALLARDLVDFLIYLAALVGGDVTWRGSRYRLSRRGALILDHSVDPL